MRHPINCRCPECKKRWAERVAAGKGFFQLLDMVGYNPRIAVIYAESVRDGDWQVLPPKAKRRLLQLSQEELAELQKLLGQIIVED